MGSPRDTMINVLGAIWRGVVPIPVRRALRGPVSSFLFSNLVADIKPRAVRHGPLIVSGFLNEVLGVGQGGLSTLTGLRKAGLNPIPHNVRDLLLGPKANTATFGDYPEGGVLLMHCNAPEAVIALSRLKRSEWESRYRIGYWVYELDTAPASWIEATKLFHEIWVPSQFAARAFRKSHVPVKVAPHFINAPREIVRTQAAVDNSRFVVSAAGDMRSSVTRKNLSGAVEIYKEAFPDAGGATQLILKVTKPEFDTQNVEALRQMANGRPDITILDRPIDAYSMDQFMQSLSVFLSPHRAEGFGLFLAEAMMAGVPVLATGWSGNVDFMSVLPELLIEYSLVPVNDPTGIYPKDANLCWAEPNKEDAVQKLRLLRDRSDLRAALGLRSQQAIENLNSYWSNGMFADEPWYKWLAPEASSNRDVL